MTVRKERVGSMSKLPFEETLRRHSTKPNRDEFGEPEMRRWWKERDFIGFIPEKVITKSESLSDVIEMIYYDVINEENSRWQHGLHI